MVVFFFSFLSWGRNRTYFFCMLSSLGQKADVARSKVKVLWEKEVTHGVYKACCPLNRLERRVAIDWQDFCTKRKIVRPNRSECEFFDFRRSWNSILHGKSTVKHENDARWHNNSRAEIENSIPPKLLKSQHHAFMHDHLELWMLVPSLRSFPIFSTQLPWSMYREDVGWYGGMSTPTKKEAF